jgi:hypothetical protein
VAGDGRIIAEFLRPRDLKPFCKAPHLLRALADDLESAQVAT